MNYPKQKNIDKYFIFGNYSNEVYDTWYRPLLRNDYYYFKNENIVLMVISFLHKRTDNNHLFLRIIDEYLSERISLKQKVSYTQYNYINNEQELVLEDGTIINKYNEGELNDETFDFIKNLLEIMLHYEPPKKKLSEKMILDDIRLKLEPLFRKEKIKNFFK